MTRAITLLLLLGFSTTCSGACAAWEKLTVKLFNDASVGNDVLEPAKAEASWLLKSVCVTVNWKPCPIVTVDALEPCAAPIDAAELHILSSQITSDARRDAMGLAMPARGRAAVFLPRVKETLELNPGIIGVAGLLGHVMAHEIGHLLLRSSGHSGTGLMRADFSRPDLKKAAQRQLLFTREQTAAIQREVLAKAR